MPRAFGDSIQALGTSTLLIESGHWRGDPEKQPIRKLNYVALLTALHAIGSGSFEDAGLGWYRRLPPNGRMAYEFKPFGGQGAAQWRRRGATTRASGVQGGSISEFRESVECRACSSNGP